MTQARLDGEAAHDLVAHPLRELRAFGGRSHFAVADVLAVLLEARITLRKLDHLCEEQHDALQELGDHW